MKTFTFFLVSLLMLTISSCHKTDTEPFKVDPNAPIYLKPALSKSAKSTAVHLSALEIVRQADVISFVYETHFWDRGFADRQRDTISVVPALMMFAFDVVDPETNQLNPHYIEGSDVVISRVINNTRDTIAYLSNAVVRAAETKIKSAFNKNLLDSIYIYFNNAYKFTPITGAEWRALKKQNLQ